MVEFKRKPYDLLDFSKNAFDRDYLEYTVNIAELEQQVWPGLSYMCLDCLICAIDCLICALTALYVPLTVLYVPLLDFSKNAFDCDYLEYTVSIAELE